MIPDVWRVPTVLGVMACSALLLFSAAVIVPIAIRRARSRAQTTVLIAALGCLVIGEVAAIRGTASRLARSLDVDVGYVDPGPAGYVGVAIFAGFVFLVGDRLH